MTSSRWIHGIGWRPPATGPPTPSRNGSSIFFSAPPWRSSTTPVRTRTTRTPSSSAFAASRSQATQTLGEHVVAGRRVLVDRVGAVAVVADCGRPRSAPSGAARPRACPRPGCGCRSRATPGCAAARRRSSAARCPRRRGARRRRGRRAPRPGAGPAHRVPAARPRWLRLRIVTSSPRFRSSSTMQRAEAAGAAGDGDPLHGRIGPELLRVPGRVADRAGVGLGGALARGLLGHGGGDRLRDVAVERRGDDVVLAQLVLAAPRRRCRARRPSSSPR